MRNKRQQGSEFEKKAGEYLKKEGYEIIAFNFSSRQGEIDIIAKENGYLVFVEVKYRGSAVSGKALEAVNTKKQKTICKVALFYLTRYGYSFETPCRFDVIGIDQEQFYLVKDAFEFKF